MFTRYRPSTMTIVRNGGTTGLVVINAVVILTVLGVDLVGEVSRKPGTGRFF